MKLGEKQAIFSINFAKLILWGNEQPGCRVRMREVTRTHDQQAIYFYGFAFEKTVAIGAGALRYLFVQRPIATHTLNSGHVEHRAGDAVLDKHMICADNKKRWYYQTNSNAYEALGDYWKSLHPNNIWGGDWKSQDGNHFEMI